MGVTVAASGAKGLCIWGTGSRLWGAQMLHRLGSSLWETCLVAVYGKKSY